MSYENAPQTKLLATHCALCGRALCDAKSVELGIGPICRTQYEFELNVSEAARKEANQLVYQVAIKQKGLEVAQAAKRLRALGFEKLAERIKERAKVKPAVKIDITEKNGRAFFRVESPFVDTALTAWRGIPGRFFVKDGSKAYNLIPTKYRSELWALLDAHYAGLIAEGPEGLFQIAA